MSVQYKTSDGWKNISSSSNNAVDTVENGNMSLVTSNAVYDALNNFVKIYTVGGAIINSASDTTEGYGIATITLQNGIARIDFEAKITTAGTATTFDWGLNRDILKNKEPLIPTIRPVAGGTAIYFNSSGVAMVATGVGGSMGLAGHFNYVNQFWTPARMYQKEDTVITGSWPSNQFPTDTIIVGTCFGTY